MMEQCGKLAKNAVECSKWILRVTEAEHVLLENHRLRAVTSIVQARLVAIAILVRGFPESVQADLLQTWENVTFRVYGLGDRDARTAVGEYVRLAWSVINEKLKPAEIVKELEVIGEIAPVGDVVENLWKEPMYPGRAEVLRYFLFRYEEHLAEEAGQKLNASQWNKIWLEEPSKSIEHIKPQSSGASYIHRLGNLTALPPGVNSKLQDLEPKDKTKTYQSCGLLGTIEVAKAVKRGGWTLSAIEQREKALIKWAKSEWSS